VVVRTPDRPTRGSVTVALRAGLPGQSLHGAAPLPVHIRQPRQPGEFGVQARGPVADHLLDVVSEGGEGDYSGET